MKRKIKIPLVSLLAVILSFTSYEIIASAMAATGYHVLNSSNKSFSTNKPEACPGIAFPASISADAMSPDGSNEIKLTGKDITPNSWCSTTYKNDAGHYCLVGINVDITDGRVTGASLSANGNCKQSGPNVVISSS